MIFLKLCYFTQAKYAICRSVHRLLRLNSRASACNRKYGNAGRLDADFGGSGGADLQ
ncbi:hypothetical protein MKLM6_2755 [Methylomonas koyamae]|nr:hypothetical protein MKLM6_2755 [Methylomonas koyamae]